MVVGIAARAVEGVTAPVARRSKSKNSITVSKTKYVRRTVELHPDVEHLLDIMQEKLKARSHTEVLQKAVQLLGVVLGGEHEDRKSVYISGTDGKLTEVIIL